MRPCKITTNIYNGVLFAKIVNRFLTIFAKHLHRRYSSGF